MSGFVYKVNLGDVLVNNDLEFDDGKWMILIWTVGCYENGLMWKVIRNKKIDEYEMILHIKCILCYLQIFLYIYQLSNASSNPNTPYSSFYTFFSLVSPLLQQFTIIHL